ncbi:glutaredoxin domain-containing protein [Sulfitobacter guttiformis]|uniref:Glutaredoxin n=1 Tax=Sulfitobacter guttiformis TaxID=74349 RepID=A0A420DHC3_9RHOB|nr:glutaredoxin domain-containing protein [Sulfitobacter guttiformis]KIN72651.1 Glutaredoxin electron transport component NrdH [Sulfitobacter guttiformis KCTC 32187]RKE93619.1 glutaredoxin [Sulfitobacter guttiformis]
MAYEINTMELEAALGGPDSGKVVSEIVDALIEDGQAGSSEEALGLVSEHINLASKAKITIYTGDGCQQCIATIRSFDEAGIIYRKVNIIQDMAAWYRLRNAGMRALPVVQFDDEILWSGFRPDMIEKLMHSESRRLVAYQAPASIPKTSIAHNF